MPVLSTSDLTRFFNEGENLFAQERPFLVDRYSPPLVAGTSVYTLPDYVISIRRITYLGKKLDPLPQRNYREVFQSVAQEGWPFWYIFNNIGANKVQLFPTPQVTIPAGTNLWGSDIPTSCIVEFNRATDNSTFVLPSWIRRQMLKQFVMKRKFELDGPGVNNKLAKYYDGKWQMSKGEFSELLDQLYYLSRKYMISEVVSSNYFPGQPVLPIDQFGSSVDEGE